MKKALSLFLAVVLIFSCLSVCVSAANIVVGSNSVAAGSSFTFEPSQSGWYSIYSVGNDSLDPQISIYCDQNEGIEYSNDDIDYENGNCEFAIYEYFDADYSYYGYIHEYEDQDGYINFVVQYDGEEYKGPYSDVESMEFTSVEPVVFKAYVDGFYDWCEHEECTDEYFCYYSSRAVYREGNIITLNYKDGSSKDYVYDIYEDGFYYDGEYLPIDYRVDVNQMSDHWQPGEEHTITIELKHVSASFTVKIEPCSVESIKFNAQKPLQAVEHVNGYWDGDGDGDDYFNYYYDYLLTENGNSITVKFTDGRTLDFTCGYDSCFYNSEYGELPYSIYDDQYYEHWEKGGTYNIKLTAFGKTIDVPIQIVENPIKSVTFTPKTPITVIENVDGEWDYDYYNESEFFYYYIYEKIYAEGNYLTVTYKDGTVDKFYYDEEIDNFVNDDGEGYSLGYTTNQDDNHWYPGKTYNVELEVYGKTCSVPVTVIPQKPATPKVTTTNEIGGVNVTWNKVVGATKYVVYRRQGGYKTWVNIGTTTGNTLLDKNVKSGIYYVYSVRAYNALGKYSDFVSANTSTRKFMATPKLTGISNATNGLYIKWNAVAGITKGYRVYRRGAGSTYWTYLGTTKNLYFTDTQVKNKSGEYFRYTVIADGGYHSKFDTTGLYLRRLANPTLSSAVSSKSGITVKWGAVKGTTGYNVYRKTANSTWVRVATVSGTNTITYLDKTAKKGTTYTYTVRGVCGKYISSYNSGISCKDKY